MGESASEQDGELISATDDTFAWLAQEVARPNPEDCKPTELLGEQRGRFEENTAKADMKTSAKAMSGSPLR